MALQGSAKEARAKRREQLRLWEESETNLVDLGAVQAPRPAKKARVKFNQQCVFLAACSAGDKDEVERLLASKLADINTTNVDGLTALHQACIDNNIEMVEFLIDKGIDINIGDNEGWTPLHATASCGYVSIGQLLLERGARLDIVNVDNELAVDRAEEPKMKQLLEDEAKRLVSIYSSPVLRPVERLTTSFCLPQSENYYMRLCVIAGYRFGVGSQKRTADYVRRRETNVGSAAKAPSSATACYCGRRENRGYSTTCGRR